MPAKLERTSGHVKLVQRQKGPVWYLRYRLPDGRHVKRRLGPAWTERTRPPGGFYTRKMAEAALRDVLTDASRGTLAGMHSTGVTFADAAAEFLRFVTESRKRDAVTVRDYRGVIDGYLLPEFGGQVLDAITADDIERYRDRLLLEGRLSARTVVRHLTVLHGIFKRAKRVYGLTHNPAAAELVERPQVVYTGEFDTFDREELDLLIGAAESAQDAAIYRVAAFTGLRLGELSALRWREVDFVGGMLHVRRNFTDGREKVPKGKRVRSVPMVPEVIDALGRLKEREHFTGDDDLVFCSVAGGYLGTWSLRQRFYKAIDRAGLRRIRLHDLRHYFGTQAVTMLDGFRVQSYMGHEHYSTTQRYLHHKPRPEDADALHQAFGGRGREGETGGRRRTSTIGSS